ncbi:MAG: hypothetical protein H7A25_02815 [Leptospiraceae bacterium]|nr:hypothetical protein [Leptospiraceae bacterium]MCP5498810.1 hypothetical protein [Leptospiraceae bacterium]
MDGSKHKPLLNRSELKQIKRSRLRVGGKKIVTDDVNKLKSLKVQPELSEIEALQYYKEPIWIEYYIPKESRFALETKFMYIFLPPIEPRKDRDKFLKDAIKSGSFMDILKLSKSNPDMQEEFAKSYQNFMSILKTISDSVMQFIVTDNYEHLKIPLYLTETMMQYEPTVASLEYFGDYATYNLNWLIKKLNFGKIAFSLEDKTISFLIKRRNAFWEEKEKEMDEDFEILSALFYEQAYPHRGAEELEEHDFLLD